MTRAVYLTRLASRRKPCLDNAIAGTAWKGKKSSNLLNPTMGRRDNGADQHLFFLPVLPAAGRVLLGQPRHKGVGLVPVAGKTYRASRASR